MMKIEWRAPIGIYDSGAGGVGFAARLHRLLPNENLLVYCDDASSPLGNLSASELRETVSRGVESLIEQQCLMVVLACNTASTELPFLRWQHRTPIHGLIVPGAAAAIGALRNRRKQSGIVGVLCTPTTQTSNAYQDRLSADSLCHGIQINSDVVACPDLAGLIQNATPESLQELNIEKKAKAYLNALRAKPDVLVLGCSHYELLAPLFQRLLPEDVSLICPGEVAAQMVWVQMRCLASTQASQDKGEVTFVSSDQCPKAVARMKRLFGILSTSSVS